MIASFFAAFMSTMSTHLNWGSSYVVNDFYKRFVNKEADEKHYVLVARIMSALLAGVAMIVAFFTESIGQVFTFVLNLTAAIGPVYFLRWFWWRINPWSEIVAMAVSLPVILVRPFFFQMFAVPPSLPLTLLFMILGSALFWVPATLLTSPVSEEKLRHFFGLVQPPGWWKGWQTSSESWLPSLRLWIVATLALGATTAGPLEWLLGRKWEGAIFTAAAILLWFFVIRALKPSAPEQEPAEEFAQSALAE
jgi:hypothetical protein